MNYDFQKAGLYPAAWVAFKANLLNMIFIAVGLVTLAILQPIIGSPFPRMIGTPILYGLSSFYVYQTIISGKLKHWAVVSGLSDAFIGFMLRFLSIHILLFIFGAVLAVFTPILGPKDSTTVAQATVRLWVISLIIYALFHEMLGTILPATIAKQNKTISEAFQRGRKLFSFVLTR
ncbi:MAG: hypothetical protein L3J33_12500 [Rhodobacteraceae bacterium]|nr:hypothetical protein [Paracoccaceae bacterium]